MRLITDILREIRKGRPVEEATLARRAVFEQIVLDVARRTDRPIVFGKVD